MLLKVLTWMQKITYFTFFAFKQNLIMFTKCSAEVCSPSLWSVILLEMIVVIPMQEWTQLHMSEGHSTWLSISHLLDKLILVIFKM